MLPLQQPKSIAVIGVNAKIMQFQGGGSAHVTPTNLVSPLDGIIAAAGDADVAYSVGAHIHKRLPTIEGVEFSMTYYNDPNAEPVFTTTTHSTQIAWFGDLPNGVEDGFTLHANGTFIAETSGTYQFSIAGVGDFVLGIGDIATLYNSVDPTAVNTPFEMWDFEKTIEVELEAGQEVEIMAEFVAAKNMPWRALRIGHLTPQSDDPIADAVEAAGSAEIAVVVAGLNAEWESEGFDRESMDLPGMQNELIARVAAANPNTIVVLNVGSPVHMPWIDDVAGVLQAWYLGQEQGNAIADVLFGAVNPMAKLPTTFPVRIQDNPAYINYPGENGKVHYGEGLFVGYRYYDKKLGCAAVSVWARPQLHNVCV